MQCHASLCLVYANFWKCLQLLFSFSLSFLDWCRFLHAYTITVIKILLQFYILTFAAVLSPTNVKIRLIFITCIFLYPLWGFWEGRGRYLAFIFVSLLSLFTEWKIYFLLCESFLRYLFVMKLFVVFQPKTEHRVRVWFFLNVYLLLLFIMLCWIIFWSNQSFISTWTRQII